jgi:phosphoglycolate phosphatase-like HAD superfamily hydrolase
MPIDCIVLDFDGTFTDVETEGAPFVTAYQGLVADLLGRDVSADWVRHAAEIAAHPGKYGWSHGGKIVAPGNADPYVRCTTVAQRLFDEAGVLRQSDTRTAIVQAFYQLCYRHTVTAFRPDARDTLEGLLASGRPVWVVTNSRTDIVAEKLIELGPRGVERLQIIGDAQKYVIAEPAAADPRFAGLAAEKTLPGLERPVHLRRGRYFEALARIWRETGTRPAETLVCGDIFELDLAMPIELGLGVHLVTGPTTAAHELAAVEAVGGRGSHGGRIADVLARL